MKGFLAIAIIAAAIYCIDGKATKEISEKVKTTATKCREEHNMDEETFTKFVVSHQVPEDESGKCMMACFMKGMGYHKDGAFDVAAIEAANKEKWDDEETINKANAASKHCIEEVGSEENECELAHKMVTCLLEQAKEHAIPRPEFQK